MVRLNSVGLPGTFAMRHPMQAFVIKMSASVSVAQEYLLIKRMSFSKDLKRPGQLFGVDSIAKESLLLAVARALKMEPELLESFGDEPLIISNLTKSARQYGVHDRVRGVYEADCITAVTINGKSLSIEPVALRTEPEPRPYYIG